MSGTRLTLATIAALAAAGAVRRRRGARAVTQEQMQAQGCRGPYFHTTSWDRLQGIAERGLEPGYGSRFGGWYANHSRGRIFLARGAHDAEGWFWKLHSNMDQAELNAWGEDEGDELLPTVVPVMLRIDARDMRLQPVPLEWDRAERFLTCSFYTTVTIPPERIWFFDGSSQKWKPISEWDTSDPMVAFRDYELEYEEDEVEAYWQDPSGSEPPRGWFCWNLHNIGKRGAFAPMQQEAYDNDWKIQAPKARRSLRGLR